MFYGPWITCRNQCTASERTHGPYFHTWLPLCNASCINNRPLLSGLASAGIQHSLASRTALVEPQNWFWRVRYTLYTLLHGFLTQPHRLKDEVDLDDKKRVVYMLFAWSNKHMTQYYRRKIRKEEVWLGKFLVPVVLLVGWFVGNETINTYWNTINFLSLDIFFKSQEKPLLTFAIFVRPFIRRSSARLNQKQKVSACTP